LRWLTQCLARVASHGWRETAHVLRREVAQMYRPKMVNESVNGPWANEIDFLPDPVAKQRALDEFATYLNPQKVRVMRAAGLDIIEAQRSGPWVWDLDGRRFLDCFTSAGSFNVGRRNPRVVAAAHAALDRLDHGNFLLCSQQKAELAARLARITPGDLSCTMFGTGGGEAIDFAIKLARGATRRSKIVSTLNGYHGHTGFALSAAGRAAFREPFEPLMPEFSQVPFGDFAAINAVLDESTAAVLLEPVQGEGGIVVAPPDYFSQVRVACDRVGALLIFDEIQTGLGRTGKLWASEHYGVVPDSMTTAKSLGGSLVPISATVFSEELREFLIPNPFIHLSTFGGSDLACAVALEVLNVIEDTGLVAHAAAMGDLLFAGLHEIAKDYPEFIADVRGLGLMVGVEYVEDSLGPRMSYHLSQHGVLAIYSGNQPAVMRLMPALVIEEPEVEFLLDAMKLALNDLRAGAGPLEATTRARRRPVRDSAKQ
jgi:putrescine aminotransferase